MNNANRRLSQRTQRLAALAVLAGGLLPSLAAAQAKTDLDVTRVALFSSGVGYFQADAKIDGDSSAELKFRTDQINDILKSLVVQDLDGGTIGVVSYASRDPIDKTLRSFGVDITGKPTLPQLLDQLRGEPIEVGGPRALKGVIVGVEKRQVSGGTDKVIEIDVLNLLTDAGIEQVEVRTVQGLKFASEKIAGELKKALATLTLAHDADKKSVVLNFNGKGQRRIMAAYLLETPIWKTSYRLVLSADKKPFLQGWATVENATEEDWNNVHLSLVSGRPISFRMDLYTPLYVPRPLEQLELYASLRPPEYDAGDEQFLGRSEVAAKAPAAAPMARTAVRELMAKSLDRKAGAGGVAGRADLAEQADAAGEMSLGVPLDMSGVDSVANAEKAGELFEYSIKSPVSIPRQHSAMLPIVNDSVEGEKLSIYNPATHPKHPLNGLELVNKTGLHLMQGPITLFDGNTYAGDAKLPDLRPNEKRLIAYALDLGAEVTHEQKPTVDQIVSLRIAKGVLVHKHKYVERREYKLKNKADNDKTLLIEQAYNTNWKLVEPKEPYDKTDALLRFKVPVAAQKTANLPVVLESVSDSSLMLSNISVDDIRWWLRVPVITPKVKEALEKVVQLRTELDDAARQRAATETQVNEAVGEQGRVRENLKTLPQNTDQYQRQLKRFDQFEDQITKLREQLAELRTTEETKRKALETYLLNLDLE
ncbi:hypothetical protein RAS1_34220 [Phycisphaerae bacterium RAS1]|nr:hypothetical protein RAS1_34220 [Phycisphaerae bacterium RAS1]